MVTEHFDRYKPVFFQEVSISSQNLSKPANKENYAEILTQGSSFILAVQDNIRKMEGKRTTTTTKKEEMK